MTISFTTTKTSKEKGTCKTTNKEVQGFVGFKRQPNKTQQGRVRSSRPWDRRRGSGGWGGGEGGGLIFFFVSVWYKYKGARTPRAPRLDPPLRFKYARDKNLLDITIFISFQRVLGHRGELYIIPRGQGSGGWREGFKEETMAFGRGGGLPCFP